MDRDKCAECAANGITEAPAYVPLTFTLTITLGNEGMQTGGDVAEVLRIAANAVGSFYGGTAVQSGYDGRFRDVNGNTVGSWAVA